MRRLSTVLAFSLALALLFAFCAWAAEANNTGDRPTSGVVRDAADKAVAGAEVWLVTASMRLR